MKRPPRYPAGLAGAGAARPTSPVPVYAEDFSLVMLRRRIRIARLRIRVLS
jgi:hypothetical protein